MLVLALDTSTLQGSVGWSELNGDGSDQVVKRYAVCSSSAQPGHAETLLRRAHRLLLDGGFRLSDVGLVVFGQGPGSFTGLRIGLSTVKGLGLARDIPAVGVCSLEAIALSSGATGLVAVLTDARRGELFGALYRVEVKDGWPTALSLVAPRVADFDQLATACESETSASTEPIVFAGTGVGVCRQDIEGRFGARAVLLPASEWNPDPTWMARVGLKLFRTRGPDDIDAAVPVYLREPDAKLPKIPLIRPKA
jgi:tRNA threonylcarbamoyladenosine biosynthesis protein TsaB